jgi:hypothetical protein
MLGLFPDLLVDWDGDTAFADAVLLLEQAVKVKIRVNTSTNARFFSFLLVLPHDS